MKTDKNISRYQLASPVVSGVFLALFLVASGYSATPGVTVTEDLIREKAGAVISDTADGILVSFGNIGGPQNSSGAKLAAELSVSEGAFVGSYSDAGVQGITLNLKCEGSAKTAVNLELLCGNDQRTWYLDNVEADAVLGTNFALNASLDMLAGWRWSSDDQLDTEARFAADLNDVRSLTVRVRRGKNGESQVLSAHECTINSVKLLLANEVSTPAARLEQRLSDVFTNAISVADLSAEELTQDTDLDGLMDYQEILYTQTDHTSAASSMKLQAASKQGEGMTLSWDCIVGGQYEVRRAVNAGGPYDAVVGSFVGAINGAMSETVDEGYAGEAAFYRIVKTN